MTYMIQPITRADSPYARIQTLDGADDRVSLPVILADRQGDAVLRHVDAAAMHDGCFHVVVPIGDCRYSAALQFGALFEWLRVATIGFVTAEDFANEERRGAGTEIPAEPVLEDMEQVAPFLFRCAAQTGFMMVHPPRREDNRQILLTAVFRPLVDRVEAAERLKPHSLHEFFDA